MDPHAKVWVAGHRGLVGSAITRALEARGFDHYVRTTSADLDLRDQSAVGAFFKLEQPRYVYLAAAKVGGIHANSTYPAEFIYDNLMIESNIIHSAYQTGVEKLLFLGSTCIYPKHAEQPIKEQSLLTGVLEPTNEWYAIAKIAGIKLCQAYREQYGCNFISAMPTNLYGPGDNFDLENSHVMPALIRKFHEAKVSGSDTVTVWGSGTPMREFLHVDDCAAACVHLMENYSGPLVTNIGTGNDVTIRELAETIGEIVGFNGD
ncbi:MAG TPA: GDP-L-fucose synthase, partial [Chromatiaceae bacterium]|nr:GDP-L-fucose synthase [Chromatiaceae bacterium]